MDSVLSQNYPKMLIWACDNESTDGTYEYLKSLRDRRLSVFSLPNIYPNGYREAIELVFQSGKTEYITFVCSDDYIKRDYIKNCMQFLNLSKNRCIQSGLICVNENDSVVGSILHNYRGLDEFKNQFLIRSPVTNPSVFYHKSLWPLIKDGREAHKANEIEDFGAGDYDMWGCFASNDVFIYPICDYMGYMYRWHDNQATWKIKKENINYDKLIQEHYKKKWSVK